MTIKDSLAPIYPITCYQKGGILYVPHYDQANRPREYVMPGFHNSRHRIDGRAPTQSEEREERLRIKQTVSEASLVAYGAVPITMMLWKRSNRMDEIGR
mgnify:CR=1 FL=1